MPVRNLWTFAPADIGSAEGHSPLAMSATEGGPEYRKIISQSSNGNMVMGMQQSSNISLSSDQVMSWALQHNIVQGVAPTSMLRLRHKVCWGVVSKINKNYIYICEKFSKIFICAPSKSIDCLCQGFRTISYLWVNKWILQSTSRGESRMRRF